MPEPQRTELQRIDQVAGEADLGELLQDGDRAGLRLVRRFPHPVEPAWRALTESEQLGYWMRCDIVGERRSGAPIRLPFWPAHVEKYAIEEPILTGEIQVWKPPTRFGWTWDEDMLLWELATVGGGTELTFTTWPAEPDLAGLVSSAAGYHLCLALLAVLLDDGTAPPATEVDTVAFRLEEAYKQRFGLA